jgi:hypothetical protein
VGAGGRRAGPDGAGSLRRRGVAAVIVELRLDPEEQEVVLDSLRRYAATANQARLPHLARTANLLVTRLLLRQRSPHVIGVIGGGWRS